MSEHLAFAPGAAAEAPVAGGAKLKFKKSQSCGPPLSNSLSFRKRKVPVQPLPVDDGPAQGSAENVLDWHSTEFRRTDTDETVEPPDSRSGAAHQIDPIRSKLIRSLMRG